MTGKSSGQLVWWEIYRAQTRRKKAQKGANTRKEAQKKYVPLLEICFRNATSFDQLLKHLVATLEHFFG